MKKTLLRYLKYQVITTVFILSIIVPLGLYFGASLHYGDHPSMFDLDDEGPYIFFENDSLLNVNYIKGNKEKGFYVQTQKYRLGEKIALTCSFPLEQNQFKFGLRTEFPIPITHYDDDQPIIAISDIEGGYKALRDFLIENRVINSELEWIFGQGHLVLCGDFVDRGWSVTQVLWFIYKLEQDATAKGGKVHFIIGNHELKNMQGDYGSTAEKYLAISNILGKVQSELYGQNSFLGRWMASKNAMEWINGHLFVHGGIHPDLLNYDVNLEDINLLIRRNYYIPYFPRTMKNAASLLTSTKTGVCWYRGYFKEDLTQESIDRMLDRFNAQAIIVGHTLQSKVKRKYEGKVFAIDVKHPKDYQKYWPRGESEGLLIEGEKYCRILAGGKKIEI